jgi:hypothetical protein
MFVSPVASPESAPMVSVPATVAIVPRHESPLPQPLNGTGPSVMELEAETVSSPKFGTVNVVFAIPTMYLPE